MKKKLFLLCVMFASLKAAEGGSARDPELELALKLSELQFQREKETLSKEDEALERALRISLDEMLHGQVTLKDDIFRPQEIIKKEVKYTSGDVENKVLQLPALQQDLPYPDAALFQVRSEVQRLATCGVYAAYNAIKLFNALYTMTPDTEETKGLRILRKKFTDERFLWLEAAFGKPNLLELWKHTNKVVVRSSEVSLPVTIVDRDGHNMVLGADEYSLDALIVRLLTEDKPFYRPIIIYTGSASTQHRGEGTHHHWFAFFVHQYKGEDGHKKRVYLVADSLYNVDRRQDETVRALIARIESAFTH